MLLEESQQSFDKKLGSVKGLDELVDLYYKKAGKEEKMDKTNNDKII